MPFPDAAFHRRGSLWKWREAVLCCSITVVPEHASRSYSGDDMEKEKYIIFLGILTVVCAASVPVVRNLAQGQESRAQDDDFEKCAAAAREILSGVDGLDPEMVWDAGVRIERLGEGAVPFLKTGFDSLSKFQQVAAAYAAAKLGQKAFSLEKTINLMGPSSPPAVRRLAAALAGRIGDSSLGPKLIALLDEAFDPSLKIALAKALWDTSREVRAKDDLRALIKSGEDSIRIPAAFALAEIGDIEPVKDILAKLKEEPTDRGRLAAVLLRQHALLKRLERWTSEGGQQRKKFEDPLLDEMRLIVDTYYVDQQKSNFERLSAESARGIAGALDPYCAYMREKELLTLQDRLSGGLAGVGLVLGRRGVIPMAGSVLFDSAAADAGFKPLDEIWEIDGEKIVEDGLSLLEIENLLYRLPGKSVKLKVYRRGWFSPKEIVLECRPVGQAGLLAAELPCGFLYVKAVDLKSGTVEALRSLAARAGTCKGLVLDLRNNPGGTIADAAAALDLFLPKGTAMFRTEGRDKTLAAPVEYVSQSEASISAPAAVLINTGTFGTAELAAAVLKARGRAIVAGEKSFGKGSIQQVIMLEATGKKTGFMLTVAKFYVDGTSFETAGVEPGIVAEAPEPEIWKPELIDAILEKKLDLKYIEKHMAQDADLLRKLAEFDDRDHALYPGFEEWYAMLETHLDRNDARALLRRSLRRHIGKTDGKPMITDLVEDAVLQKGFAALAAKAGVDLSAVRECKFVK